MYYQYDRNGNVVNERTSGHSEKGGYSPYGYDDGVYSVPYGFALSRPREEDTEYERTFAWDFSNRLIKTRENNYTVHYRYGFDNKRVLKYTEVTRNESLYFNNMWQISSTNTQAWLQSKHIFVGDTRIATKSSYDDTGTNYGFEEKHQYWYHGDHLGSAQLITNYQGLLHERIEYAPYGELWIEHPYETDSFALPYLFTGKELDPETNLYYYGARYLDPKRSRWISGDPAMGEYIPGAPVNDEARNRNQNLPGMGGIFNIVNLHTYHYSGNNPVRYVDPDGRKTIVFIINAPTAWEKIAGASHVGVLMTEPKEFSTFNGVPTVNGPTLYDPSGHYLDSEGRRHSSGLFVNKYYSQENEMEFSLEGYLQYHLDNDGSVTMYSFNTTPEQEAELIGKASQQGDSRGIWCALDVSRLLSVLGIKPGLRPGKLQKQLDKLEQQGIITKEVFSRTQPAE
ncbi:MAG: RHS repeat-associated core domain-containing protein [Treponema sp.]|nr:RHS repeat-associated core domain-containing protein [Treponema sp.]